MARITDEQKIEINCLYKRYGTYAEVARQMGISPSTVKKYVIPDFVPPTAAVEVEFDITLLPNKPAEGMTRENFGDFCKLSREEIMAVRELWKEITL